MAPIVRSFLLTCSLLYTISALMVEGFESNLKIVFYVFNYRKCYDFAQFSGESKNIVSANNIIP